MNDEKSDIFYLLLKIMKNWNSLEEREEWSWISILAGFLS